MNQVEEIATVIVCDGNEDTLDVLSEHLTSDHFEVLPASTGADALRFCRYNRPDILILALDLPDMPGLDVLKTIREADGLDARFNPYLAIIVLIERGDGAARARSIQAGADEYVQKPISFEELKSRMASVLRRRHSRHDSPTRVGQMTIDPARRKVTIGEREIHLSKKEFTLLRVLASDPTRIFSKDELLREVWGFKAPMGRMNRTRTLDSHASRLRKKLDPEGKKYVVNAWGIGYGLVRS